MVDWHAQSVKEALESLHTNERGLGPQEAQQRLKQYGPNTLQEEKPPGLITIFLSQFNNPVVWVLFAATAVSAALHEYLDAAVIGGILILNAVLGTVQEYRAERAIDALMKLVSLKARVLRNGHEREIDAAELVPGDIILLETGNKVPADARLIEAINLATQEAALTGESNAVRKKADPLALATQVADRTCMVFSGTVVTAGRAKAVVAETGMKTELGKIAAMIKHTHPEPTPLQKRLAVLSKQLAFAVIAVALLVFGVGYWRGMEFFELFITSVALAVAAIPEGLPAVVTIALGIGVQRMARRHALIRKLPSAETLGACTVICSDKTGTLTHNEMTIRRILADGRNVAVGGQGYEPIGTFSEKPPSLKLILQAGCLNNNASLAKDGAIWRLVGDPTEGALLVSARKAGLDPDQVRAQHPRIAEIEFTSERKRMTTIHKSGAKRIAFLKGAPEVVLARCSRILINGQVVHLTRERAHATIAQNEKYAGDALRILGFAYRELTGKEKSPDEIEKEMIFIGLQAMSDPPRKEVKEAINKCRTAGIKVVMITGDHLTTAAAVAKELGITGKAITGADLEQMTDFPEKVEGISIYARVNPEHKVRIVDALKARGHVVAMTGDGVNDAPALKKADIGIAMGITGTDVAKEAGSMILADDNFASIVNAVEEGRTIFDNIVKFVDYLLSSNAGEILTLFLGIMLGFPLPVIALQLLWINLITDGLPALALGIEPPEPGIMRRPPRQVKQGVITGKRGVLMLLTGLVMAIGTLGALMYGDPATDLVRAQSIAFTTLVVFQLFNALNKRSEEHSLLKIGILSNKKLLWAIGSSLALQAAVLYIPFLQRLFSTEAITLADWGVITAISASILVLGELVKLFSKSR